jgi:hypothetical protein
MLSTAVVLSALALHAVFGDRGWRLPWSAKLPRLKVTAFGALHDTLYLKTTAPAHFGTECHQIRLATGMDPQRLASRQFK